MDSVLTPRCPIIENWMNSSAAIDWTAFAAAVPGMQVRTDAATCAAHSHDFYWYSPILKEALEHCRAQAVVAVRNEAEVIAVAAAAAQHRVPLTVRAGATGNYGQCVPLAGGLVMDVTGLHRITAITTGQATVAAGALLWDIENAARTQGQELLMFPSTLRQATIGGFVAGGYAGVGSIRHGILKDAGNVNRIRVVTVERTPRVIDLHGADIQKVHHAFGTNGIITELDIALAPAVDWRHVVVLFDDYIASLQFSKAASRPDLALRLLTNVDRRFAEFYTAFGPHFPANKDAVFALVGVDDVHAFEALAHQFGGWVTLAKSDAEMDALSLPPAYECAYNHTTLMALKHDRTWTYLQCAFPQPFDVASTHALMEELGEEVWMHHEFGKQFGEYVTFALPLVRYFDKARLYEIMALFESKGIMIFDPHVLTIEDGGMKRIDLAQIEFKKIADPMGLMNPGKTRGWTPDMAVDR
jgi:FAD/FMN-containing dehydrogenase